MRTQDRIEAKLGEDEDCEWLIGSLRTIGPTSAAGKLCLTNRRLIFVSNGYGNLRSRSVWSIDRSRVREERGSTDVAALQRRVSAATEDRLPRRG